MDQVTLEVKRTGATATCTQIRGHSLVLDRPEARGGTDAGPMAGEAFLASIGGCFLNTLIVAAQARNLPLDDAVCTVTGTFLENPRRFGTIDITVECAACPSADLEHLVALAERGCMVLNTLRGNLQLSVSAQTAVGA
jgi:putative redox protein